MWDFLYYCLIFLLLTAGGVAGAILFRGYFDGAGLFARFFSRGSLRRVQIVERKSLDNRRKLVLIQRDDVEHLIMTGGPVDVVIETGIGEEKSSVDNLTASSNVVEAPVFSRAGRKFRKTANES